jgi:hypothetical protein
VELFRQRTQRLGEQAQPRDLDGQLAGLGAEQGALGAQDVAEVPVLERFVGGLAQRVAGNVELDAAGHVLDGGEARLAHHALEHHPAGHGRAHPGRLQFLVGLAGTRLVQVGGQVGAAEVVGKGVALGAQRFELRAPLGDDLVIVVRRAVVFLHSLYP